MKVLQFKTEDEISKWLNDNEMFQCYDKEMNLLGDIQGPDADFLVSFGLAEINMKFRFCQIIKELTPKQIEELKKNRLVKVVATGNLFRLTLEQRVILKRLRKNFEDAKKVGLYVASNDGANKLYFFNGNAIDRISTDDDLSGEWKEVDGKQKFCEYSEDYLSEYVKIDPDVDCESIEGSEKIDFISWGCGGLPWFAHLKL